MLALRGIEGDQNNGVAAHWLGGAAVVKLFAGVAPARAEAGFPPVVDESSRESAVVRFPPRGPYRPREGRSTTQRRLLLIDNYRILTPLFYLE